MEASNKKTRKEHLMIQTTLFYITLLITLFTSFTVHEMSTIVIKTETVGKLL